MTFFLTAVQRSLCCSNMDEERVEGFCCAKLQLMWLQAAMLCLLLLYKSLAPQPYEFVVPCRFSFASAGFWLAT